MPDNTHTEEPPPMGEASPMPPLLYWNLWVPVFAVTVWGMMLLFGRKPWRFDPPEPLIPAPPEPASTPEDATPDDTEPS